MFIRKSQSKRNGKVHTTFQVAESYRDKQGKIRQNILLHLGPADKFLERDVDSLINGLLKAKGITIYELESEADSTKSFGQIWALLHLWKELKISQIIARCKRAVNTEFDLEKHIQSLVFNRLDDPSSKLKLLTWLDTVYIPGIKVEEIRYEYLLRAMDFLISNKERIEDAIAKQMLNMFNSDLRLCFYDLTSSYFEAESSLIEDDIRQHGYSRDMRGDREQIVIGVVLNGDGIPLSHYVFSGNTADRSTVKEVIEDISRRYGVDRITLVADKGMLSGKNIIFLIESGKDFILGDSARQGCITREVIAEADKERKGKAVEGKEYIYEAQKTRIVKGEDGKKTELELRYVACYNPDMATKRYQTRTEKISKALRSIEEINGKSIGIDDKYSKIKELLGHKRLSRFFMVEKEGDRIKLLRKDKELYREDTADGWFIVVGTNKELSKDKVIEKYKELKYVEHGFYELKHSLNLRPNYHWTEQRIRGHVMVCFMAFQIGVLFEKRLKTIGLSWERAMERLSRLAVIEWKNENRVRKGLLKVKDEQMNIYDIIGASKPTLMNL